MNTYATELITRERIADWHRAAQDELSVRSHSAGHLGLQDMSRVARGIAATRAGRLAFVRRFAAMLGAAA